MSDEKLTTNQITIGILFLIIILAGYIGADALIQWRKNKTTPHPIEKSIDEKIAEIIDKTEVKTPEKESLPEDEYNGIGGLTQYLQEIDLITSPYTPTADVYVDSNTYREIVPRLGLKGEFEVAALLIKGEINNDLVNFLSINVGEISGTYGVERLNTNTLNLEKIAYSDAILTKGEFEIVIDLKSEILLSTTKPEYLQGKGKFKNVALWNYIMPQPGKYDSTIARAYASIYDEHGTYGNGSQITGIKFIYVCSDGVDENCGTVLCNKKYDKGSKCLEDAFGKNASENYIQYFKKWFNGQK